MVCCYTRPYSNSAVFVFEASIVEYENYFFALSIIVLLFDAKYGQ